MIDTVLGIETSCDETSIAVYNGTAGLLSHQIYSHTIHREYGGVVPELAAREHCVRLLPLLKQCAESIPLNEIDGIAYTQGPGLPGALLTGSAFAQALAWSLNIPIIGIHHLEGHLLSPLLSAKTTLTPPFLSLLISGGHTLFVEVSHLGQYHIIGQSLDDAIGEAFDKTGKLLGLDYPAGQPLELLAKQGDPDRFKFPRPMTNKPTLDMSFSGLKTHVRNVWMAHRDTPDQAQLKADIAAGFQQAVCATIHHKLKRLMTHYPHQKLVCAGGVAANQALRQTIISACSSFDRQAIFPEPELCTDNAAMIAYAGYLRLQNGEQGARHFDIKTRWPLDELTPISPAASF